MAGRVSAAARENLRALFEAGTTCGLTDRQLLERFTSQRDSGAEAAFRTLVARHGAMVLGVCRRVLRDSNDADDAFQATFLILVRKAGSVRVTDSLGRWLYGVSYRVAIRVRATAAKRLARETPADESLPAAFDQTKDKEDLRIVLDEELERLPTRYSTPIVLCDLDGLTHEEAARQLRCPVGTVKSRLSRGREQLRHRLLRRGLAGLATASFPLRLSEAAMPDALVEAAVRSARQYLIGQATAVGTVSASVATMTEGVLRSMFVSKLTWCTAAFVSLGVVASGTYVHVVHASGFEAQSAEGENGSGSSERRLKLGDLFAPVPDQRSQPVASLRDLKQLMAELETKRAQLRQAQEASELAVAVLATQVSLREQKKERISLEEISKAEAEVKVHKAQTELIQAQIRLLEMRRDQAAHAHGRDATPQPRIEADRPVETGIPPALEHRLREMESKIDHVLSILKQQKDRPTSGN